MEIKTPLVSIKLDDYIITEIIDENIMSVFDINPHSFIKDGYVYTDHSEYDPLDGKPEKIRVATKSDEAAILVFQTILTERYKCI